MSEACPKCQTPFEPGSGKCIECGYDALYDSAELSTQPDLGAELRDGKLRLQFTCPRCGGTRCEVERVLSLHKHLTTVTCSRCRRLEFFDAPIGELFEIFRGYPGD